MKNHLYFMNGKVGAMQLLVFIYFSYLIFLLNGHFALIIETVKHAEENGNRT